MLSPKRQKFRKMQKGRMKGNSHRGHRLSNGMFGIKSLESKFITSRQIEAARIAATRYMKREGQLWIKIFPDNRYLFSFFIFLEEIINRTSTFFNISKFINFKIFSTRKFKK